MTKLLLDTQVLVWFAQDDDKLRPAIRRAIEDGDNQVFVSVVSFWEVAIKVRVGKMALNVARLREQCMRREFGIIDLVHHHVVALMALPVHPDHRDPFDHLLLAQATAEGAIFVSADRHAGRYGVPVLTA